MIHSRRSKLIRTFTTLRVTVLAAVAAIALQLGQSAPALAQASDLTMALAYAAAAIGNKDYTRAVEIYSGALEQDLPDDKRRDLLRFRAVAFDLAGQTQRAEADLTAAVMLGNPDSRALHDRGFFYLDRNRFEQALADFEAGAGLAPGDAAFAYGTGRVRAAKREYAAAIKYYSKAIALDAKTGHYWMWRGEAHALSGNLREGMADYDKALAVGGLSRRELAQLRVGRGDAHFRAKEFQAAVAEFDAALALNDKNPLALRMRGAAFERLGAPDKARVDYERALSLSPNDAWVKERLQVLRGG